MSPMLLECCVNVIKSLSFNKLKLMLRACHACAYICMYVCREYGHAYDYARTYTYDGQWVCYIHAQFVHINSTAI